MYHVTGVTVNGRRFRIITDDVMFAMGVNLYRGSVWRVVNNKRKLIKRVWN